jgi:hypothetical protein
VELGDQARRIRAAQELGGFGRAEGGSVEELAAALQAHGSRIGLKRLRELWRGRKRAYPSELRDIAAVCALPEEFFAADLAALADDEAAQDQRLEHIEQQLGDLLERLAQHDDYARTTVEQVITQRVNQLETVLRGLLTEREAEILEAELEQGPEPEGRRADTPTGSSEADADARDA